MSEWRAIMDLAEAAKQELVSDKAQGRKAFERLLCDFPRDGMVYFKRGEAFEVVGEYGLAMADFRMAESLFPMPNWKASARDGFLRAQNRLSFHTRVTNSE
ncbi:MAG: hypothetical protein Q7O66_10295 [Dehalococcoidia bacterium]|nr:hypothetical protein [Dehalococcoidia bacterium]